MSEDILYAITISAIRRDKSLPLSERLALMQMITDIHEKRKRRSER